MAGAIEAYRISARTIVLSAGMPDSLFLTVFRPNLDIAAAEEARERRALTAQPMPGIGKYKGRVTLVAASRF